MSAEGVVTLLNAGAAGGAAMMLRACVQGGLFVLAVWAVCRAFPCLPASGRGWLWWLACLKLLVGLCGFPAIALPLLPQARPILSLGTPSQKPAALRMAALPGVDDSTSQGQVTGASALPALPAAPRFASPNAVRTLPSWLTCLAVVWLLGVLVSGALSLRHYGSLRRLLGQSVPLEETPIREGLRRLVTAMGLRRAPRLVASADLTVPCVGGLFRPAIALPANLFETLTSEDVRLALAHELAHLRRGDLWLALIPALARALFWFFPLAWLACREYETAREEACDAIALRITGAHPARYGQLLLRIVTQTAPASSGAALGLTAGYAALRTRLVAIARPSLGGQGARRALAFLLALALLFVLPWRLTAIAARVSAPSGQTTASLPGYLVTELDAPGGRETSAVGLNDRAQVVGESAGRALLWKDGMAYVLKPSGRFRYGLATGVNNNGQIIASSYAVPDHTHAVVWDRGHKILGALSGYPYSEALGINDGGQVVGDSLTAKFDRQGEQIARAFLWSNGRMRDLGTLGGDYSYAYAINMAGQVAGKADTPVYGSTHAFLWQGGQMRDLGTLPSGQNSLAYALNNSGQAAGFSQTADGSSHAVLWDNGQAHDLGVLDGDTDSEAHAVNDRGQVVGASSGDPASPAGRAFLWQNGRMMDLNSLLPPGSRWALEDARAINSVGQIVGQGLYNGRERAFLLTPLTHGRGSPM